MATAEKLPTRLTRYKRLTDGGVGVTISLVCYHYNCDEHPITAVLYKDDGPPHPAFGGAERVRWDPQKYTARIFLLKENVCCPNCNAEFVEAVIAEGSGPLIIIGYEAEGC